MYENAQYMKDKDGNNVSIRLDIDGVSWTVPMVAGNTDYGQIRDLIESGDLVVAPAEGG